MGKGEWGWEWGTGNGEGLEAQVEFQMWVYADVLASWSLNPHLYYEGLDWIISKLYFNTKVLEL